MKRVTLGGDRLGSGNKQKVDLHGFERSTHDLGYVWRNTQAPGTLVPFMVQLALPGDSYDINLGADVKTHPTIGPLFGSFKLQLDIFECPIRLYHSWLHNNKLGIGNNMSSVKLPQYVTRCNNLIWNQDVNFDSLLPDINNQQISQSSLLAYLGNRGIGWSDYNVNLISREFNAIPLLSYYDIYKNYYANKQEEIGYIVHASSEDQIMISPLTITGDVTFSGNPININEAVSENDTLHFAIYYASTSEPEEVNINYLFVYNNQLQSGTKTVSVLSATPAANGFNITFDWTADRDLTLMGVSSLEDRSMMEQINHVNLLQFDLSNIDEMRDNILKHDNTNPFLIDHDEYQLYPYTAILEPLISGYSNFNICSVTSQEGLAIKTYQSDIFNNWLNTDWIDGPGGINDITKVDTSGGSFDINTLQLAKKVYDMLNRIAVSGGSYEDWLEAVYDHDPFRKAETPIYCGGLSKEIIFQEVVANVSSPDGAPQGNLAGKGTMSRKHKGGTVNIKVSEPCYLIGIVSITPRIDYSQGNEFFVNHTTMDDLHKPNLDQIGFQELVTDKMAFWDTYINGTDKTFKSAGKQPAWIDYMTNYNKLYGNFANDSEMYMTLARRYEPETGLNTIKDLTTYIDPTKFNYAFAQTDLSAMNFWVQIGVDITARRKMSAKIMPNL